jgi:hypothetical protein
VIEAMPKGAAEMDEASEAAEQTSAPVVRLR